jgi:hypothetical protein
MENLRQRILLLSIVLIATFAKPSAAQECTIGVFVDPVGSQSVFYTNLFEPFTIYVVRSVESTVNAVAMRLIWPTDVAESSLGYGPSGGGINVASANGDNIGLGECAVGFGGAPVLVSKYVAGLLTPGSATHDLSKGPIPHTFVDLAGNADENETFPVYSDCAGTLHTCEDLTILQLGVIAIEAESFGSVKSLYGS